MLITAGKLFCYNLEKDKYLRWELTLLLLNYNCSVYFENKLLKINTIALTIVAYSNLIKMSGYKL